ncbi:hypothetical protein HYW87_02630 [Candidatus Roizmanbacteria bacterium]|nr:hypothetical protein [Candidatus Roizmanbacteria bacterium]
MLLAQKICFGDPPQCIEGPLSSDIQTLGDLINKLVGFLVPLAAIILFLILVWGGFNYMMSAGDPEKVKSARAKITSALIGFILLILSYLIVKVVELIFGFGGGIL